MRERFTDAFISAHQTAFDEYLALGVSISQKAVSGEEAPDQYIKALKLQSVLKARQNSELTVKEAEALDGCLSQMSERRYTPSLSPLVAEDGFLLFMDGGKIKQMDEVFTLSVN